MVELAQISKSVYNTNIVPNEDVETQKLLDDFSSSFYGEALKFYVASGVNITPAQAQQAFETYLTKTGRADTGLKVDLTAAQGKNRDLPTVASTQEANASETKTVVSSSEEALASLKEQAQGKKVGDTVSTAFTKNGQVKVYTASVNEFGINPPLMRNATVQEKAVLQGDAKNLANATNETGSKGIQNNVAERTEGEGYKDNSSYKRPSGFRKGVRNQVWDNAKNTEGNVIDPVSGRIINPNEPWDMGHKPGFEFRKHQQSAQNRGISRKQFIDEYNIPNHYRPELPGSNRSHIGEDVTKEYFGD